MEIVNQLQQCHLYQIQPAYQLQLQVIQWLLVEEPQQVRQVVEVMVLIMVTMVLLQFLQLPLQ